MTNSEPKSEPKSEPNAGPADAEGEAERQRRKSVAVARRLAVTVLGGLILAAGLVMMVLPGPGLIVIVLGLFVLSLEFEWASKRLDQARDKAVEAAHKTAASPTQTAVALLSAAGLVAAGVYWGTHRDLPASNWFTAGTVIFGGLAAAGTVLWAIQDLKKNGGSAEK